MYRLLVAVAVFVQSAMACAEGFTNYVGLIHPPTPPQYKELGGWMIGDTENGIACVLVEIDGKRMYWLEQKIGTTTEAPKNAWPRTRAVFRVSDVLPFPHLRRRETMIVGMEGLCSAKEHLVESIIAVGTWVKKKRKTEEYVARIRQAWRANPAKLRFEPIDPNGVHCEYSEEGVLCTECG